MIRAIDMGIEQVYNAAQQKTDRETIIIFGSDNGGVTAGRHPLGCNYPLKGGKSSINEFGFNLYLILTNGYKLKFQFKYFRIETDSREEFVSHYFLLRQIENLNQ